MDTALHYLYVIIPFLHILTGIALLVKAILVFNNKGFDLPAVIISFFRIYSSTDVYMTNNNERKTYMRLNNYINYYLYLWLLATIIVFVVFQAIW